MPPPTELRRAGPTLAFLAVVLAGAACAVRLGSAGPTVYRMAALPVAAGTDAVGLAGWLDDMSVELAVLVAPADSGWFAALAGGGRSLSGPAMGSGAALAFSGLEPVGDTTIRLDVPGSDPLVVQDALYGSDGDWLDLMAVRLPPGADSREAARVLLSYVATDVMHAAAVVLVVSSDDAATAADLGRLLRPAFDGIEACGEAGAAGIEDVPPGLGVYFSPPARVGCESVRVVRGGAPAILFRPVVR